MTDTFVTFSLVAIWSAMAMYALAFIAFTFDLARRAAPAAEVQTVSAAARARRESAATGAASTSAGGSDSVAGGSTAVLEAPTPSVNTGLGENDPAAWKAWHDSLLASGDLAKPLPNLEAAYNNDFVEAWSTAR